ncbi:ATP-binding protein [Hydrogenophaga crocea]|uniref:ATP-binding protein n=1 Tax=Hydrogenophaga crocea TaxID=2716225 RepID=UPI001F0D6E8D|nr:ATP-binding protein [Hydrogenophaga crocea]
MLTETTTQQVKAVGIRPNSSILSVLSHLNYKAWYAVAEFVDNSIQSYLSHKDALQALHGAGFKLKIRVWLDQANNLIEISDNAAGIRGVDFPRAFRPAEIPTDRTGLSEFGMGMKTAACWFTHTWNVRTKALGETVERIIRFDLDKIVNERLEQLEVVETPAGVGDHYTVLRLENLGKKFPVKRTQKKLRDHLASIYRMYLRSGEIELYFDEDREPLQFDEPEVLVAPPYSTPTALPVQWKKPLDFQLPNGRRVWGFAAIRKEASTAHAGFALFRRNRLILGSDDESYRPQDIFGNSNSFRYQRLFGELNVEGFEVSHTKDGFRWDDLEEEFLQVLRDNLRDGVDLLKQADNYRARPTKGALQSVLKKASSSLAADMTATASDVLSISGLSQEAYLASARSEPEPTLVATESKFSINIDGQLWNVLVRTSIDPAITEWVRVAKVENSQLDGMAVRDLTVDVSMAHPFVQQYIGPKNENAELFLRLAVGYALAAEKSNRAGHPVTIAMHWFNRLLRESLAKGGNSDGDS